MSMMDYEPSSGFNLPPGCFGDDIDALFAAPRRCGTCSHGIQDDSTSQNECFCDLIDEYVSVDNACGDWEEG